MEKQMNAYEKELRGCYDWTIKRPDVCRECRKFPVDFSKLQSPMNGMFDLLR